MPNPQCHCVGCGRSREDISVTINKKYGDTTKPKQRNEHRTIYSDIGEPRLKIGARSVSAASARCPGFYIEGRSSGQRVSMVHLRPANGLRFLGASILADP